jgi:hypothetical protein
MLCALEDITITDEEIMLSNTIALSQELKGTDINTPKKIQEYINKKYEGDSKM